MNIEELVKKYSGLSGTTLQVDAQRKQILSAIQCVNLMGIVKDINESAIIINQLFTSDGKGYARNLHILITWNQSFKESVLHLHIDDVLKISGKPTELKTNNYGETWDVKLDLIQLEKREHTTLFVSNQSYHNYELYINEVFVSELKNGNGNNYYLDGSNTYSRHFFEKGKHRLLFKQKAGYIFYPTEINKEFVCSNSKEHFYFAIPANL